MQKTLFTFLSTALLSLTASAGLQDTAAALDETIQSVELQAIVPGLAEKLGVDVDTAKNALLVKGIKLSDLALAKFVAEKTNETVDSLLEKQIPDWSTFFGKNSAGERDAAEHLDMLQTEVALMMLDFREGRKK